MKTQAVLLDLDGTLADTAPDLVAVLNKLQVRHRRPAAEKKQKTPRQKSKPRAHPVPRC